MAEHPLWFLVFNVVVVIMLIADVGLFRKNSHVVSIKEALLWSIFWIVCALGFNVWLYFELGQAKAVEFLTGYIIEKALSVDNLFVFVLLFSYFKVSPQYQHKVLFWGVLGALIMRASMIIVGASLIEQYNWVLYIFGAFLVYTGGKMLFGGDEDIEPEHNPVAKFVRKYIPMTPNFEGDSFFIRSNGTLFATPLFLVLTIVEVTDLVFAVDSIPAIFSITTDSFIVYTSNVFAILGLRSLYFVLAGVMDKFHFLKIGLGIILGFVGIKMLSAHYYHFPVHYALGFVVCVLLGSIVASLFIPQKKQIE